MGPRVPASRSGSTSRDPIPGMAEAIDPKIPADIKNYMAQSAGAKTYTYNGAFYFTDEDNKRKTKAWTGGIMPRLGLAFRIDDKTALRAGYGRFVTPTDLANAERDTLGEMDLAAFSPSTSVLSSVNGVPAAYLANPFPQGLTPAYGKTYGRYTNLGDAISIDEYEQRTPVSDRINVSLQRELPGRVVADATYFVNFISHDQYNQNLNLADPRLGYTYGAAVDKSVANPFYNYGTVEPSPAPCAVPPTVAMSQLFRPYPQYGDIIQTGTDLRKAKLPVAAAAPAAALRERLLVPRHLRLRHPEARSGSTTSRTSTTRSCRGSTSR